eukprot:scaffold64255_cov46-Phaeocystis_antarctica.AAC.3
MPTGSGPSAGSWPQAVTLANGTCCGCLWRRRRSLWPLCSAVGAGLLATPSLATTKFATTSHQPITRHAAKRLHSDRQRVAFVTLLAGFNSLLAAVEQVWHGRAVARQRIHPRPLFVLGHPLCRHVRPGASILYVRATRTGLLRGVRTEGAGQLAPRRHALYVPPCAYQPRACRAYRVPCGAPQVTRARGPPCSTPCS